MDNDNERANNNNIDGDNNQLRSLNNNTKSFVSFENTTNYFVEVLWINFEGQAERYFTLKPFEKYSVNTFVTHPWIFVEKFTKDRFMVDGKEVYYPKPWYTPYIGMSRDQIPRSIDRVKVSITLPVYSLRDISLRAIKCLLKHDHHAFSLEIPRHLQLELASMLPRKDNP